MTEHLTEEAFRVTILTEMVSYELYRNAVVTVSGGGRQVFERLARGQAKLIDEILEHCPAGVAGLADKPKDEQPCPLKGDFKQSPQRRLLDHLRMAMRDKQACIDRYATFVRTFREPGLCRIFELALSGARKQYGLIVQEYRQADQRVHRPGVDRRSKRTHLRGVSRPVPNKHSQLFISLLDSGRPSPF